MQSLLKIKNIIKYIIIKNKNSYDRNLGFEQQNFKTQISKILNSDNRLQNQDNRN